MRERLSIGPLFVERRMRSKARTLTLVGPVLLPDVVDVGEHKKSGNKTCSSESPVKVVRGHSASYATTVVSASSGTAPRSGSST
jgi:hypothetical protein